LSTTETMGKKIASDLLASGANCAVCVTRFLLRFRKWIVGYRKSSQNFVRYSTSMNFGKMGRDMPGFGNFIARKYWCSRY